MAKKEVKVYAGIINTVSEAKKYLTESVSEWTKTNEKQIIRLARFAEKFRKEGSPDKKKIKLFYTSMNQIRNQILRDKQLELSTVEDEKKLAVYGSSLAELETKYGKYVPPKPKTKKKEEEFNV